MLRLGNDELIDEFRYLVHINTSDFRDDYDVEIQFRRQNELVICWLNIFVCVEWEGEEDVGRVF